MLREKTIRDVISRLETMKRADTSPDVVLEVLDALRWAVGESVPGTSVIGKAFLERPRG